MRKSRFTETQIVSILEEHDAGATFVELGRRHGVHPNTVAAWKSKYGGMESSELARARAIEDENARMRRIIANLSLENDAMKESIAKNSWGPRSEKPR
jgi:putative transposase